MNERLNAIVGARISEFRRKMAEVRKTIKSLPNKTKSTVTVISDETMKRVDSFQRKMDKLANTIRSFGTVLSNMVGGGLLMASPSTVPILAAAAGLIGSLGPMVGVLAGSTFALATAFGFAGTAAVAFGAVAIPAISKLFDENTKLNKAQKAARAEFNKFKKTWQGISKELEKPALDAFSKSMQFANKALQMAKPLFKSAATAANNLLNSLNKSLDTPPVKAFFDYMNKNAGPLFEKTGKSIGYILQGLMSMLTAFGPLAEKTAQGFLNMSKGFADWAAGLSKSEKFQSFVSYVNENMPKLRAIFRDVTAGLVYMFSAFGPLSSDMMTGLQNLMTRFKEWARTLGENQQFQKFIDYIRTNAPTVMSLIGNLVTTLVNFGIAIAPIGQKVLQVVNSFFAWTSSMLEAHPWLGKMVAGLLMIIGAFQMVLPGIILTRVAFGGLGGTIAKVIQKVLPIFSNFKLMFSTGFQMLGVRATLFASKLATTATKVVTSLLRMGQQAVVWAGKMVAQIARVIARFVVLSAKAALHAGKVALSFTVTMVKAVAKAAAQFAVHTGKMIAKYALLAAKSAVHAAKVALSFTVTLVKAVAKAAAQFAIQTGKMVAKYALLAAKSMIHAARVAASFVVAMGPVGWVIATIVGLVAVIIANWDKIKSWTIKTWNKIWSTIKEVVGNIVSKVKEMGSKILGVFDGLNLYESGKAIIQSAIDGIKAMKDKIVGKVEEIVQKVRNLWPFSPAKEGPLSDIHHMDFAGPIGMSINKARRPIMASMTKLANAARTSFTPDVAMADIGTGSMISPRSLNTIKHSFSAELNDFEISERPVVIHVEGDAEWLRAYVNEENAVESVLRKF